MKVENCTAPVLAQDADLHWVNCQTDHVEDVIETTEPLCFRLIEPGQTEDSRSVYNVSMPTDETHRRPLTDGDTGNTNPLLNNLQPNHELHPPANMQLATAPSSQHGQIRSGILIGFLHGGHGLDLAIFLFGFTRIFTTFTTESTEDVACFFVSTHFDQPSR